MRYFRVLVVGFLLLFPEYARGQAVDDIIKHYVDFIGGKKNWKKVKTMTTSGEYNYGGIPFPFHTYAKAPNQYKFVVPFNGKYYAQAFDGSKGWKIDAFKNETTPTLLTGSEALAMANEANVELEDAFIDYKKKGHRVILEGKEDIGTISCYKVKFIRKGGEEETYYFSDQSYQIVRKTVAAKNVELQGALLNISYSDYRSVDGIKVPFVASSESDGQIILVITLEKVMTNIPIGDSEFQPE